MNCHIPDQMPVREKRGGRTVWSKTWKFILEWLTHLQWITAPALNGSAQKKEYGFAAAGCFKILTCTLIIHYNRDKAAKHIILLLSNAAPWCQLWILLSISPFGIVCLSSNLHSPICVQYPVLSSAKLVSWMTFWRAVLQSLHIATCNVSSGSLPVELNLLYPIVSLHSAWFCKKCFMMEVVLGYM